MSTDNSPVNDSQSSGDSVAQKEIDSIKMPDTDPLIGQILFSDYMIIEKIGDSPAISTYKAKQKSSGKYVVMKTTKHEDAGINAEFVEDATRHMSLTDEHIAASIGLHQTRPLDPFYVTEWLEGVSLSDFIEENGSLSNEEEIAQLIIPVCNALACAHENDVVHRNLSFNNIFLCLNENSDIHIKVCDFGFISVSEKLKQLEESKDPNYLPTGSEQSPLWLEDQKKNDIMMVAYLILGLVTGKEISPYKGDPRLQTPLDKMCPELLEPDVLNAVFDEAMEPDLDWRYNSIAEFKDAFEGWLHKAKKERRYAKEKNLERTILEEEEEKEAVDNSAPGSIEAKPKKQNKRSKGVRATLVRMTALKETQVREEGKLTAQFSNVLASEKPKVSPLMTMTLLAAKVVVAVSLVILTFTYLVLNWEQLAEQWTSASMKLSSSVRNDGEVSPEEAEEIDQPDEISSTEANPKKETEDTPQTSKASNHQATAHKKNSNQTRSKSARRKFRYNENPAYRHWVLKEVGPKRRIEPKK